nr:alanine aminotransferase 2-like [Tanacetum cinerariifolium]
HWLLSIKKTRLGRFLLRKTNDKLWNSVKKEGLVLLADKVYQENVYAYDITFNSFKKI